MSKIDKPYKFSDKTTFLGRVEFYGGIFTGVYLLVFIIVIGTLNNLTLFKNKFHLFFKLTFIINIISLPITLTLLSLVSYAINEIRTDKNIRDNLKTRKRNKKTGKESDTSDVPLYYSMCGIIVYFLLGLLTVNLVRIYELYPYLFNYNKEQKKLYIKLVASLSFSALKDTTIFNNSNNRKLYDLRKNVRTDFLLRKPNGKEHFKKLKKDFWNYHKVYTKNLKQKIKDIEKEKKLKK